MGRQNKVDLPYFELDCHMDTKIELIEAEFGLKGFALVIKLYQHIYGGEYGYYCEWTPDTSLLWALRYGGSHGGDFKNNGGSVGSASIESGLLSGFPKNFINEVVAASIRRNIFSEDLFRKYGILTSSGIQKQYLKATVKRESVEMKKEYLLISVPENRKNVVINAISSSVNAIDSSRNTQSKSNSNSKIIKNNMCKADAVAQLFDRVWELYPVKKGKGRISDAQKMRLFKIGFDEMSRAIDRYKQYVESVDYLEYQNGSTFFNSGYVDYLDANYSKQNTKSKKKNSFNNFLQRDYDFTELEKQLIDY